MDSPVAAPPYTPNLYSFPESPLSTKREKQLCTPLYRKTVPRLLKVNSHSRSLFRKSHLMSQPRRVLPPGRPQVNMSSPHYCQSSSKTYFEQLFLVKELIGEGSFGQVYSAISLEDKRAYAVKVSKEPFRNDYDREKKLREVLNHMSLPLHDNIVQLINAWEEQGKLYIQQELCQQSLLTYCETHHALPETQVWDLFVDLIQAVNHIHSHDMIHDDIKPDNIFLTKTGVCKLGDLGLAINLRKGELKSAEEGDSKYLAPEVLNGRPSKASDIFSLGVTILEAATDLLVPSCGDGWHLIRTGNIPERFFDGVSDDLRGLIELMLSSDPSKRPTAKSLLEHHMVKRKKFYRAMHLYALGACGLFHDGLFSVLSFVFAVFAVIAIPFIRVTATFKDHHAEISRHQTPLGTPNHTESRFVVSPRYQFDNSDDENIVTQHESSVHRRLFSTNSNSNFSPLRALSSHDTTVRDEGDVATSSSNSSMVTDPALERMGGDCIRTAESNRDYQHNSVSGFGDVPSSSDEQPPMMLKLSQSAIRAAKLRRMMSREMAGDSADDSDHVYSPKKAVYPQSCPAPMQRRRPLRKLDFGVLDDKGENDGEEAFFATPRILRKRITRSSAGGAATSVGRE